MNLLLQLFRTVSIAVVCLGAMTAVAQSFPPAWSSSASYAAGDTVEYGGNWYRAMVAQSAGGPYPAAAYGKWELNFIRSNTTLTIGPGQGFANLVYAWQFARNARIADAAYLHLVIVYNNGGVFETFDGPFSLDHGSGALISISSSGSIPELSFPNSNGFVIDSGHSIGSITSLDLYGGVSDSSSVGVSVTQGATIVANSLLVDGFETGIYAASGGNFVGVGPSDCAYVQTVNGLYVDAGRAIGLMAIQDISGNAIVADHGATVNVAYSYIAGASEDGVTAVTAQNGATVDVDNADIAGFSKACVAQYRGYINCSLATISTGTTLYAKDGGGIYAAGANLSSAGSTDSNEGSYIWSS